MGLGERFFIWSVVSYACLSPVIADVDNSAEVHNVYEGPIYNAEDGRIEITQPTLTFKGTLNNHGIIDIPKEGLLKNEGVVYNYYEIEGCGVIDNHKGEIYNANFFVEDKDHIADDYRVPNYSYDIMSPAQLEEATYYDLVNESEINIFKISKFAHISPDIDIQGNPVKLMIDPIEYLDESLAHTGLRLNPRDEIEFCCQEDKRLYASFFTLPGYTNGVLGAVDPVDCSTLITKSGPGRLEIDGEQSWYNGAILVKESILEIMENTGVFGGRMDLMPKTELIMHGGPKDDYNKPDIYLTNAKISFVMTNDSGDNAIFSYFGRLTGDASSTAAIEKGTIFIKGDCSNFKGHVVVSAGADFAIRVKPGYYEGLMFGGIIDVMQEDGVSTGGHAIIRSDAGLTPLTLRTGVVELLGDEDFSTLPVVQGITIGDEANLLVLYDNSVFTDSDIHGDIEFTTGTTAVFENMNLDGGLMTISSGKMGQVNFVGDMKVGSGFNMLPTNTIVHLDARAVSALRIIPNRNLAMSIKIDPLSGECDYLEAPAISFSGNSAIVIPEYRLLSEPFLESHMMQVVKLTATISYPPIIITSPEQTIHTAHDTYHLTGMTTPGMILLCTDSALYTLSNHGISMPQLNRLNNQILPLTYMHSTGAYGLAREYRTIMNTIDALDPKRVHFWRTQKWETESVSYGPRKMDTERFHTLFGIETRAEEMPLRGVFLKFGVFGGFGHREMYRWRHTGGQKERLFGTQMSLYDKYFSIHVLGARRYYETYLWHSYYGPEEVRTVNYSLGTEIRRTLHVTSYFSVAPGMLVEWLRDRTDPIRFEGTVCKYVTSNYLDVLPSLRLEFKQPTWKIGVDIARMAKHLPRKVVNHVAIIENQPLEPDATGAELVLRIHKTCRNGCDLQMSIARIVGPTNNLTVSLGMSKRL